MMQGNTFQVIEFHLTSCCQRFIWEEVFLAHRWSVKIFSKLEIPWAWAIMLPRLPSFLTYLPGKAIFIGLFIFSFSICRHPLHGLSPWLDTCSTGHFNSNWLLLLLITSYFSTLAWRIPWTEELGGLQSVRSQRFGHPWVTNTCTCNLGKYANFFHKYCSFVFYL